jgi:hypothetical protein
MLRAEKIRAGILFGREGAGCCIAVWDVRATKNLARNTLLAVFGCKGAFLRMYERYTDSEYGWA